MWYRSSGSKITRASFASLVAMMLCILLVGCNASISLGGSGSGTSGSNASAASTSTGVIGSGVQGVQLFVEPNDGDRVITNAIAGAKKTLLLEMYLLTERNVINALEEASQRGIDVRVMLEIHPYGGGSVSPQETLDRLKAAGVNAKATSPNFSLTHEKGMVIDGKTAYIMTSNFTASALGSSNYTKNREYGIIDSNAQDVQAVIDIFNADWNHSFPQITDPDLVVSPVNSRAAFTALINSTHHTLLVEAEEMQDSNIEQAIVNAGKRGVQVQVILPSPNSSSSDSTGDSNSSGISAIGQSGVQVKEDPRLYMHAKIIVADGQKAFVGSENISSASLDGNRELGIIVSDQNALNTLQQTFQQDWSDSHVVQ